MSLLLHQKGTILIKNPLQEIAATHLVPETEGKLKGVKEDILLLQAKVTIVLPAIKTLRNLIKKMRSQKERGDTTLLELMRLN